jgi:hypothetical protein
MDKKNKRLSTLILPAALALAIVPALPRGAAAMLAHQSGTTCVANKADVSKLNYDGQKGIYNDSTSKAGVYCALPYDDTDFNADHGNEIGVLEAFVVDQNPSSDAICQTFGINGDGSVGFTTIKVTTTGASPTPQPVAWDSLPLLSYTVVCSLPGTSNSAQSRVATLGLDFQD